MAADLPVNEVHLNLREAFKAISTLFKMRVVSLLLLASLGGAFLGGGGIPSVVTLAVLLVTGMLAAGGASALNQYLERETDPMMRRTAGRPLATGSLESTFIPWLAIGMIGIAVFSVMLTNPAMAFYLALGAFIYVVIYTIWLKPRTVANIVIGGAAGSCAVMAGGAAVNAAADPGVITLALLVFLWTPAHFWALAMFHKDDYTAADIPMLPVYNTAYRSAWWILIHAISAGFAAIILAVHPALGVWYAIPASLMAVVMVIESIKLVRNPDRKQAIRTFVISNIFLAVIIVLVMVVSTATQLFSA
jgi:protoheme IX farnesyltransferase